MLDPPPQGQGGWIAGSASLMVTLPTMAKEAAPRAPIAADPQPLSSSLDGEPAKTQPTGTIEDHFRILEEAVAALESDELPLEDALKRYETGLAAVRNAGVLLDSDRARLEELRTT